MTRRNADDEPLIYQLCIEWSQPERHGHDTDADGALCIIFYKLKNLDRATYEQVRLETQADDQWDDIQFDDDLWNSDLGLFYMPIRNGADFTAGFELLHSHFLAFADSYGE